MIMKQVLFLIFTLLSIVGFSQETLSELLTIQNTKGIPYITVQELAMPKTKAIILDARELEEYNVSHIKKAIFVGYNSFFLNIQHLVTWSDGHTNLRKVDFVVGTKHTSVKESLLLQYHVTMLYEPYYLQS